MYPIKYTHSSNKLFESIWVPVTFTQAELIKQLPARGQSLLKKNVSTHVLSLKVSRWLMTTKHFNKLCD